MPSSKFSPDSLPDLSGRVYLVTGGNAGIGKATVAGLAAHGAKVYMGARSEAKAAAAIEEIRKEIPNAEIEFLMLDLMSFESVVKGAGELISKEKALHGLINNAGIMAVPFEKTRDGFESQIQTNYLSHYILTNRLLPLLLSTAKVTPPGTVRIVNLTSVGHTLFTQKVGIALDDINLESAGPFMRYGQSKLANILHAKQLHVRYGPVGAGQEEAGKIWIAAVHPGQIDTALNRKATGSAPSLLLRSAAPWMRCVGILDDEAKGAWSSLFAVAGTGFTAENSGAYVVPYAKIGTPSSSARNEELALRLWEWTEKEMGGRGLLV